MLVRALVLLLATVVACLPAALRADWDGTEGRRVQIALEMLRSGDWMVPTLGGEPTWAKPPLHYWLLAAVGSVFGDGWIAMRIPSVLGAFGAAFVGGELLRRWFGPRAGWLLAFGVLCSPLVLFVWPTAEIDPLFASLTGVSLWLLATGVARERARLVLASGVCAGLAFLQKGPPFFLFACGAYLVWARHRRLRFAAWHFVPMLVVVAAWFVPLWVWRVDPGQMLAVANEESVGRIATFRWHHVRETPAFWLRAVFVQLPFVLWCFWEWRGARNARMGADDVTLRMCSGAAVLAVALLTFFPARPTRYLLPNVLLFTFAVAPAVAHFAGHRGSVPRFARAVLWGFGVAGAIGLLVVPFVPRAGATAVGLAAAAAVLPLFARTPRRVVLAALLLPVCAAWTVGLERSLRWHEGKDARSAIGRLLRAELDAFGATEDLATWGHVDSPTLLATGLLPPGDEQRRAPPTARWLLHEHVDWQVFRSARYAARLRMRTPYKLFLVHERVDEPR